MPSTPDSFLKAITPYREDIVVAVECIFTWYWLADLCTQQNIPFVLGHALYMENRAHGEMLLARPHGWKTPREEQP